MELFKLLAKIIDYKNLRPWKLTLEEECGKDKSMLALPSSKLLVSGSEIISIVMINDKNDHKLHYICFFFYLLYSHDSQHAADRLPNNKIHSS